jgi:4-diphosphocytidyl-2-C-methyl-D-erythritol kinase
MILFPNAKINIGLYITEKRADGYHNLETIFYPVSLTDILEIQKLHTGQQILNNTGIQLPGSKGENLCYKAYQLIRHNYSIPEINIHLHKIIPYGSGLGGGSSDASFTLKALNRLFQLNLDREKLKYLAEQLGSDCSFFIDNAPSFAWEKGNRSEPINLSIKGLYLMLVVPDIQIDTRTAYHGIIPGKRDKSIKEVVLNEPVENWNKLISNDFENHILKLHPLLEQIKQQLVRKGALFTSLSGSGSTIYGLFREKPDPGDELSKHFTWIEQLKY